MKKMFNKERAKNSQEQLRIYNGTNVVIFALITIKLANGLPSRYSQYTRLAFLFALIIYLFYFIMKIVGAMHIKRNT